MMDAIFFGDDDEVLCRSRCIWACNRFLIFCTSVLLSNLSSTIGDPNTNRNWSMYFASALAMVFPRNIARMCRAIGITASR